MLDLRVRRARTTQGQPPAAMTLAGRGRAPAGDEPVSAPAIPAAAPTPVDPRAVADRVYALFEAELRQLRSRCGGRFR